MWNRDIDTNRWSLSEDNLSKNSFDVFKQELSKLRFYSKCLSGSTYIPMNDVDNVYDILGDYIPKNWYISSPYSVTPIPSQFPYQVSATNSSDFYDKYLGEYGMSLKNLFTPSKLINDSIDNYLYVDVATTDHLYNIGQTSVGLIIDGVRLLENHRVLVKNQVTNVVLSNVIDPSVYFQGQYEVVENLGLTIEYKYYNEDNGIYIFKSNKLIREKDLDEYSSCIRYSVIVKLGTNSGRQFHLQRLTNGYYPIYSDHSPMYFKENHNWMIRNRVDYNNLFEINYHDILKSATHSYTLNSITYSMPERTISVGQYGIIWNNQEGSSNIIENKYKVTLRSINEVSAYYWICGDDGTLLKIEKYNFSISKISLPIDYKLTSVSFFNDVSGVVVGESNTIFVTSDGGVNWSSVSIPDFDAYNYNDVIYDKIDTFYVVGNSGVFIEFTLDGGDWSAYLRKVIKYKDSDEYLLVDDINYITRIDSSWNLSYDSSTYSVSPISFGSNNGDIIIYDSDNDISSNFSFYYLDFSYNYGDILSFSNNDTDSYFSNDIGVYNFDLSSFGSVYSTQSNIIFGTYATVISDVVPNKLYDYNQEQLLICGNKSILDYSTYPISSFSEIDSTFINKLKSKMLFMDYDIGSKLNFFDSDHTYRMPDSVTFSSASFSSGYLYFNELIYSGVTESNWMTYWSDRLKTFEYGSTMPLDESSKVLMSFSFSCVSSTASSTMSFTSSEITILISDILPLAPMMENKSNGRYYLGTYSYSSPSPTYSLFIYDYLMIVRIPVGSPNSVGDVFRMSSDVITGDFIINKIYNDGSYDYFYMFTEFNQSIVNQIKSSGSSIDIVNLNLYSNDSEFSDRFNIHPISNAYSASDDSSIVTISPIFNNFSAYYNLSTGANLSGDSYTMSYSESFLDFGYSPTYNILSYLGKLNSSLFYDSKEYLAMPIYNSLSVGALTASNMYIDSNYNVNKLFFGSNLKFEWESILLYTFVDLVYYDGTNTYNRNVLLVTNKYYDSSVDGYVIEFHKAAWSKTDDGQPTLTSMDIVSRRTLGQISDDLQELNMIQRKNGKISKIHTGFQYSNYENELNFKFPTDSYTKILLSDVDTFNSISSVVYTDYKNELSMNVTKLDVEYKIPILNTSNYSGILLVSCSIEHGLSTGDGAVLEFTGGTGSSQDLNPQYFGYHIITSLTNTNFTVDIPYGLTPLVGNDIGFVKYIKGDQFINYVPIDIIDVGVDKKGKQSTVLTVDNIELDGSIYKLKNVDYNKHRFRLIDGLNIDIISSKYPWILEAEIENAIIGTDGKNLIWYSGNWECGRWFGGIWKSGIWKSGDWYGGIWESRNIKDKLLSVDVGSTTDIKSSIWNDGRWFDGVWEGGTWKNGRWYGGTWESGDWYNGIWNDGIWKNGRFIGGIWVTGNWFDGIFNTNNTPSYWLDGKWHGGDFENGMWYNGVFNQAHGKKSRFGTNSFNSRTSTWHGGKWSSGEFHSSLNLGTNDSPIVSDIHKFSIWHTGIWSSGNWYGGIAYDMDFRSGIWHGGILEDIEVIGIATQSSSFTLNGIFKYNLGDNIYIIDNNIGNTYSYYGSNSSPEKYIVLDIVEDTDNNFTEVYVDRNLDGYTFSSPGNTGLRVVSHFNGNWKSGIWTNGIFSNGLWEGGIWYNGVFQNGTWV
jgi:hypothetical protein